LNAFNSYEFNTVSKIFFYFFGIFQLESPKATYKFGTFFV